MADELTEKIIGAAIEVHRILGPGLLESIYQIALSHELQLRGVDCEREVAVNVNYKGVIIQGQRIDLIVANAVGVELKSLIKLPEVALAQVLSYLRATGFQRGLLINFGESLLKNGIKRISL